MRLGQEYIFRNLRRMVAEDGNDNVWSDDRLNDVLTRCVTVYNYVPLIPRPTVIPGNQLIYTDYPLPTHSGLVEMHTSGHPYFMVTDWKGEAVLSDQYNVDYELLEINFISNTDGKTYYLTFRTYDLNRAAANIWADKAAERISLVNFKTDNHTLAEDQEYQHCLDMKRHYEARGGVRFTPSVRGDTVTHAKNYYIDTPFRKNKKPYN